MLYYNCSKGRGKVKRLAGRLNGLEIHPRSRKKSSKTSKKPLDKHQDLWYNKDVPREQARTARADTPQDPRDKTIRVATYAKKKEVLL